jgi:hypothetical protein
MFVLCIVWVGPYLYYKCIILHNQTLWNTYNMLKIQIKIKFRYTFWYITNVYIYFIKNKNLIVSWYYDMILRYDTADKKTILPSIPILKTLPVTTLLLPRLWRRPTHSHASCGAGGGLARLLNPRRGRHGRCADASCVELEAGQHAPESCVAWCGWSRRRSGEPAHFPKLFAWLYRFFSWMINHPRLADAMLIFWQYF